MDGGLLDAHMEQRIWKTYLRRKMRAIRHERELCFVFVLSHLRHVFWILAFG